MKGLFALAMAAALSCATLGTMPAHAEDTGLDQVGRADYLGSLKGKKVIFIPIAMGFDITESWAAIWRKQAGLLGYTTQNLIKSIILLGAIIIDTLINPRDEQTAQQGDI